MMNGDSVDELTPKQKVDLDTRLEETHKQTETNNQSDQQKCVNWDLPDNVKLCQYIVSSWTDKNDLHEAGETFNKFCKRVAGH